MQLAYKLTRHTMAYAKTGAKTTNQTQPDIQDQLKYINTQLYNINYSILNYTSLYLFIPKLYPNIP